ncbi:MAG: hypothetical protein J6T47_04265 [Lachnospiraceae bacterium]|nr:hypothetical protein [Lachnospiraceae bacterium]
MEHKHDTVSFQGQSIAELEKDLRYFQTELEVVQLKKEEAITFSLKMVVLIVLAAGVSALSNIFLMKNEWLHVLGIALMIFCFAVMIYGGVMLIQRVPLIVSQQHVETGIMMRPADLKLDYERIIAEKEKLLAEAREREEQLQIESEARRLEAEAARKAAEEEYGGGEILQTGDEHGISTDENLGLTISLEDALNEIRSVTEEEE